ncbi:MAG: PHB depolymerase family esterase [Sandaracinaceae bacterium]
MRNGGTGRYALGWLVLMGIGCAGVAAPDGGDRADGGRPRDGDAGSIERIDASVRDASVGDADALDAGAADATAPGCGSAPPGAGWVEHALLHDGLDRAYIVVAPSSYDARTPLPLVLAFNGRDGSPEGLEEQTRLSETAEAHDFLLLYPRGSGGGSWNGGPCCGSAASDDVDDVGFVRAVLDDVEARYCVDTHRIYATGLSNGGFMANRVGCEIGDRVAAIAPVAGMLLQDTCTPAQAVGVVHFHGTLDYIVPYNGNSVLGFPPVEDAIALWAAADGCDPEPSETYRNGDVVCETYVGCSGGVEVELCRVRLGGHTWPDGYVRAAGGYTTHDISANEHMWEFFQRHTR